MFCYTIGFLIGDPRMTMFIFSADRDFLLCMALSLNTVIAANDGHSQ